MVAAARNNTAQFVHFIYPNISLLVSPSAVELFQLYPGKTVDEHMTRYRCYWRTQEGGAGWRQPGVHRA